MASFGRYGSQSYAPSAPSLPEEGVPSHPLPTAANSYGQHQQTHSHGHGIGYGQDYSYGHSDFPPGTSPDVLRSFQMVDRDRSGFIDENELQQALSSGYQRFSLGTIRLLMFLFKNPNDPFKIGEFLLLLYSSKFHELRLQIRGIDQKCWSRRCYMYIYKTESSIFLHNQKENTKFLSKQKSKLQNCPFYNKKS